jgi:hypothetical protein
MLDESLARVVDLRPVSIHGMAFVDVALALVDGRRLDARLGPEAVPDDLAAGETVVVVSAMANVLELRRPRAET